VPSYTNYAQKGKLRFSNSVASHLESGFSGLAIVGRGFSHWMAPKSTSSLD